MERENPRKCERWPAEDGIRDIERERRRQAPVDHGQPHGKAYVLRRLRPQRFAYWQQPEDLAPAEYSTVHA